MVNVKRLLWNRRDDTRYFECRRCGHAVASDSARCPECDVSEIASYTLK